MSLGRYLVRGIIMTLLFCSSASCWHWSRPWYPSNVITPAVIINYDSCVKTLREDIEDIKTETATIERNEELHNIALDIEEIKGSLNSGKPNDEAKPKAKKLAQNLETLKLSINSLLEET